MITTTKTPDDVTCDVPKHVTELTKFEEYMKCI